MYKACFETVCMRPSRSSVLRRPACGAQVERRATFDHVVIETTGLADPAPIIQTFRSIQVPLIIAHAFPQLRHTCFARKLWTALRPLCIAAPSTVRYMCYLCPGIDVCIQAEVKHVLKRCLYHLQYVAQNYALDGVLTLVDAKHIGQHLDERKPEGVVNEALSQVAYADRIILNKTDLVRLPTALPSPDACNAKCSN